MIAYSISLLFSLSALVMTISLESADADSSLFKYYNIKEILIMLGIAIVLILIGWFGDDRRNDEDEDEEE